MQRVASLNIEELRRRIDQSIRGKQRSGARLVRPASELDGARQAVRAKRDAIEGEERENAGGRFLLRERFFDSRGLHGRFRIERLQSWPGNWIRAVAPAPSGAPDARRWAFLDTETTGLAGGTGTCAFLVGVGSIEESGFRVKLFFMRDFDEEPAMLKALSEHLAAFDVLVTYNGKSFDGPLLESRFRLKRLRNPLDRMAHADLLHPARRIWRERMPNCCLSTLEAEVLGFERRGDVPGFEIPRRYFDFLRTGRAAPLEPVFRHNAIDIVSLACLGAVVTEAFAAPQEAVLRHGQDLLGLARWLGASGDGPAALDLYRKAIRAGLPDSSLWAALWEAAQLERRAGNHREQLALLRDLSRASEAHRPAALVEIAKHYEHREKDCARALRLTRSALMLAPSEALAHRESRLLRKIGSGVSGAAAAG